MQDPAGESPLAAITRLRAELAELAGQLAAAGRGAGRPVAGEDVTGTVRVTLDASGRPAGVEVGPDWRARVGAEGLADAVRQAWQAAAGRRLTAWGEALDRPAPAAPAQRTGPGSPAAPPRDGILPPGSAPGDLLDPQAQGNLSGLLSLLADAEAALDRVERAGGGTPVTVQGRDPAGRVTVVVSADSLIELRPDRRWLGEASGAALGAAIRQALTDAYAELDRAEAAGHPPVLDELTRLTADPLALLRTVGLLRD